MKKSYGKYSIDECKEELSVITNRLKKMKKKYGISSSISAYNGLKGKYKHLSHKDFAIYLKDLIGVSAMKARIEAHLRSE